MIKDSVEAIKQGFDNKALQFVDVYQEIIEDALESVMTEEEEEKPHSRKRKRTTRKINKKSGYTFFMSERRTSLAKGGYYGWDIKKTGREWNKIKDTDKGKPYHKMADKYNKENGL